MDKRSLTRVKRRLKARTRVRQTRARHNGPHVRTQMFRSKPTRAEPTAVHQPHPGPTVIYLRPTEPYRGLLHVPALRDRLAVPLVRHLHPLNRRHDSVRGGPGAEEETTGGGAKGGARLWSWYRSRSPAGTEPEPDAAEGELLAVSR